ncbi:peptidoglycan bridge formation glycyltransferase FemA/FemB family protein [Demequina sp. B12]|uniref:lipid II:glycine glycyltransferase FemX n=1 Tax=Demequina sp. B12 TaxID=2992757 RepID=UPI00237BA3FE|nr:peptidoglycan bridge formation glycyltransferase FemA/FemB family protein [Demequina sp. B12]MDE0572152.1 peptidoglycan bridge formation glycyltransferase FemA/FemB family protein [Demequina sp. B12]
MTALPLTVSEIGDQEFVDLARRANHPVPIEQAPVWDAYDEAVEGRAHWRRLVLKAGDDAVAVISLSAYEGRGFRYLWARHGPVWVAEQTSARAKMVRRALVAYVKAEAPWAAFIRLHAATADSDLRELLQTVTYDRTVVIDLTPDEEAILGSFSKTGRKKVRRTLRDTDMVVTDESGISAEDFAELYEIYRETAERDGFGIFPIEVYLNMIEALGENARVWVARRHDTGPDGDRKPGRAVSWIISTVYDNAGCDVYGGSNAEAFATNAAIRLKWEILLRLKAEGVTQYDLMGVGSERAPTLMGVRDFKAQFGEIVEVDGAWDVPVKPLRYRALVWALKLKRALGR